MKSKIQQRRPFTVKLLELFFLIQWNLIPSSMKCYSQGMCKIEIISTCFFFCLFWKQVPQTYFYNCTHQQEHFCMRCSSDQQNILLFYDHEVLCHYRKLFIHSNLLCPHIQWSMTLIWLVTWNLPHWSLVVQPHKINLQIFTLGNSSIPTSFYLWRWWKNETYVKNK